MPLPVELPLTGLASPALVELLEAVPNGSGRADMSAAPKLEATCWRLVGIGHDSISTERP
jgi:hypothetical protein